MKVLRGLQIKFIVPPKNPKETLMKQKHPSYKGHHTLPIGIKKDSIYLTSHQI